MANVDLDCVINFIHKTTNEDRQAYIHTMGKYLMAQATVYFDAIINKKFNLKWQKINER